MDQGRSGQVRSAASLHMKFFSLACFVLPVVPGGLERGWKGRGGLQRPRGRMLPGFGWGPPTHERGNDTLTGWEI